MDLDAGSSPTRSRKRQRQLAADRFSRLLRCMGCGGPGARDAPRRRGRRWIWFARRLRRPGCGGACRDRECRLSPVLSSAVGVALEDAVRGTLHGAGHSAGPRAKPRGLAWRVFLRGPRRPGAVRPEAIRPGLHVQLRPSGGIAPHAGAPDRPAGDRRGGCCSADQRTETRVPSQSIRSILVRMAASRSPSLTMATWSVAKAPSVATPACAA